jgi:oligopeptide transport system ATP-binding protein
MTTDAPAGPTLEVENLTVSFHTTSGVVRAVNGISYQVRAGESLAILGESGSGKSVGVRAVMGILRDPTCEVTGSVRYRGRELLGASDEVLRSIRGDRIAMVFQDALSALNPVMTVGDQIAELFRTHRGLTWNEGRKRAVGLLERVAIPDARRRVNAYPHQFSGGMRQRVMIAMALALDPEVLIADEPTTALDVTVQAQIMELLAELQAQTRMALILITHDVGVVAEVADRLVVMYAGRIVESGPTLEAYRNPAHPYTRALLASIPPIDRRVPRLDAIPGAPPDPVRLPTGCPLHPRCSFVTEQCRSVLPMLSVCGPGRASACHCVDEVLNAS